MALDNITYGSRTVNAQLIPVLERQAFASGNAVGPLYAGGAASPATVPPNASTGGAAAYSGGGAGPMSTGMSGVLFLLGMLVIGVLGLRFTTWRK